MPEETDYLPKQPLDLPRPQESLPREPQEIPAHLSHQTQDPHPFSKAQSHAPFANVSSESPTNADKTLLTWTAPGRPFRTRDRSYFINILILMLIIEVILFLFSQYMLMLVVVSLVFVNYALSTVAPHDFKYKISTQGFRVQDHFYIWEELYDFYFKKQQGQEVLILRTKAFFPGELLITLGQMHKDHLKNVLLPYLPFREFVPPSSMEKAGDWLSKTFPLERART